MSREGDGMRKGMHVINLTWKIKLRMVFFALMLCLTGCGGKNRDALEEDMSEAGTRVGSNSDATVSSYAETGSMGIPEHVRYTVTAEDGAELFELDADVTADGYDRVGVYDMELVEVDEAYLRELAGQIFDGGEYEVVKPYQACTMEELLAEEGYIKSLYAAAGIEGADVPGLAVQSYIEFYNESDIEGWEDGQVIREAEDMQYDDIAGAQYESIKEAKLRGTVDGEVYQLQYERDGDSRQKIYLKRLCKKQAADVIFDRRYSVNKDLLVSVYGDNPCDREQTEQTACDIIKKLGFSDMEPVSSSHLIWNRDAEQYADGYSIIFARVTDGIQPFFLGVNSLALLEDEYDGYSYTNNISTVGSYQQYIRIDIDSTGFFNCTFNVFYRVGEKLAEETGKLSFEQVCAVADAFILENAFMLENAYGGIKEIRLCYITLRYQDKYVLAPVWLLLGSYNETSQNVVCGINALDGEFVYFGMGINVGDMIWD